MAKSRTESAHRWLIVFISCIAMLLIFVVLLVLLGDNNEVELISANTPQGVVQRYLLALQEGNLVEAYNYLSFPSIQKAITFEDWSGIYNDTLMYNPGTWKATLEKVTESDSYASVEITVEYLRLAEPFENPIRSQHVIFQLTKVSGQWSITSPYFFQWVY